MSASGSPVGSSDSTAAPSVTGHAAKRRPTPDAAPREWLRQWAHDHPRWGFRRAYHAARAEGWYVNHKRLQRLWREEGLRVPQRRRRKRLGSSTTTTIADAANRVWAVDLRLASSCESRDLFPQSSFQVRG